MGYVSKRVNIIFTGGTIAGNVAQSSVSSNIKSEPGEFIGIIEKSIEIIKSNWNIEIYPSFTELFNVDSSSINPEHWTRIIDNITETYDEFDSFIVMHGTNTMGYTAAALSLHYKTSIKQL